MSPLIVSSSDEDPELPLKDLRFGPLTRGSPRSVEDLNYRASHLIQTVILRMADRNVSEAVDTVRRAVFSVDASIEQGPRNTGFLVTCQHLLGAAPARNPQPEPVHAPLSAHEDCRDCWDKDIDIRRYRSFVQEKYPACCGGYLDCFCC
ncbi:unnamed protein product [Fusarium graminearum]|uniref:Uncharacterized protein n=1 Tax=Gibberella zeae TaxID=5518 RepID=A0A4E9EIA1_GIBZA|nr:unnamed protein product [Fusarium graminearum]CAG1988602.1 unnamed protein product [Fusarium graminearum]CAG1994164.1 unnamed protein product [Fusarium graminearum]